MSLAPDKDQIFTRELAERRIVSRTRLLALLEQTKVNNEIRERIRIHIARDFDARRTRDKSRSEAMVRAIGLDAQYDGTNTLASSFEEGRKCVR
jgi:hypothetical protein